MAGISNTDAENETLPTYSIVIVNYNSGPMLVKCVESVLKFTDDFELVIVDNGSTDCSDSTVASLFPQALVLGNVENLGFARANNIGIERAKGRFIVLLNPDTIVTSRWLDNARRCADSFPQYGIVASKLLRLDGRTIDSAGHIFEFNTGHSRDRGSGETDHGQYDVNQELISSCFACVLIRREVIDDIGLLDGKMILYYEDIDFCLRARVAGWKVIYCPNSVVYHARGRATPRSSKNLGKRAVAYRLRIMLKCYSRSNALKFGAGRVLRDILAMAAGIKNNDLEYFLSHLRSPLWNLLNLPIQERRLVQSKRRVSDEEITRPSQKSVMLCRMQKVSGSLMDVGGDRVLACHNRV